MVINQKTPGHFYSEQERLNEIRVLFFNNLITREQVQERLLQLGYGKQGSKLATDYMDGQGKKARKDFLAHLSTGFVDKILGRFNHKGGKRNES